MITQELESQLTNRARAAYLGLAIGDALGATVEFMTPTEIHHNYAVHDTIRGGGWLRLPVGQVTDDTTMSLAWAIISVTNKNTAPTRAAMLSKPSRLYFRRSLRQTVLKSAW